MSIENYILCAIYTVLRSIVHTKYKHNMGTDKKGVKKGVKSALDS